MARASASSDVFNAVGERRRRQVLNLVATRERSVGELAEALKIAQPLVSGHLRVLRDVGAVSVRDDGRQRLYRLNPDAFSPIADWLGRIEALWDKRLDALDDVLLELTEGETDV